MKKKPKRRRKTTKRTDVHVGMQYFVANCDASTSVSLPSSEHGQDGEPAILINEHPQVAIRMQSLTTIKSVIWNLTLAVCSNVTREEQESISGVWCTSETTWTPMMNRRTRSRVDHSDNCYSNQTGELQSTIKSAWGVTFQCHEGVPGLNKWKGCTSSSTSLVPIAATSIVSRIRSRRIRS